PAPGRGARLGPGGAGAFRRGQAEARAAHGGPAAAEARRARRALATRQGDASAVGRARGRARAVADIRRARLVERAVAHAGGARSRRTAGAGGAAGTGPARSLGHHAALLRLAGRPLVADDGAAGERGAPRAPAPRLG